MEWDIHVQKMFEKKHIFVFSYYFFNEFSLHYYMIYIIL